MPHNSNGFYVSIDSPSYQKKYSQGFSFQLTPTGARYFFVGSKFTTYSRERQRTEPRDISTQYRSIGKDFFYVKEEKEIYIKDRLIEHTTNSYPESVIPDYRHHETLAWVAFPILGMVMKQEGLSTSWAPRAINLQVASGLRAFTVKDMVKTIFGEAPRQLQAAAARSLMPDNSGYINIDNLTLASLLRGYLPPNDLAGILQMNLGQNPRIQDLDKISANQIRLLLRRLSSKRLMRLMRGLENDPTFFPGRNFMLLRDSASQYADARKNHPDVVMDLSRQFKSIEELHETISHEYRKLKNPDMEISYDEELIERLFNIALPDGAKLVWPNTTHELIEWASDGVMNNCIYSYGKAAADKDCILLAIVDSYGKMVVNVMIRGRSVVQCYGKSNRLCDDDLLIEALFDGLISEDIINEENNYRQWVGGQRGW